MTDEDQRALAVKTVAAVFMSVACVSVMLRCYVRGWLVKGFGWDDGSMVLAMVFHSVLWIPKSTRADCIDRPSISCSLPA